MQPPPAPGSDSDGRSEPWRKADRSIRFGLRLALGLRLEGELLLEVGNDAGDATLDELAHERPERRLVRTLGQKTEGNLKATHVGATAAVGAARSVAAKGIL